MKLVDMHCDTIGKIMDWDRQGDLMENQCSVSIPKLKQADSLAQFFACFVKADEFEDGFDGGYQHVLEMIHYIKKQEALYADDLAIIRSFEDIAANDMVRKLSAVVTVEEGGVLNGNMGRLEDLYDQGVRLITLMWNFENCLGHPNSKERLAMQKGLKPFGIEAVKRMGELGMIVDVSHASDGSFWDVLKYAKGPIAASHSNCRALCDHPRNLTDEMIKVLAQKGGVSGLNLYGAFLGTKDESRIDEMCAHILHMINVGGEEFPAIGTDFDGFGGMKRLEIPVISEMEQLWYALKKRGVAERQLEKIWNGNALRILKEI